MAEKPTRHWEEFVKEHDRRHRAAARLRGRVPFYRPGRAVSAKKCGKFGRWYSDGMDPIVKIDPEIMHGTPCFAGTRVPVKILFDYLHGGDTVDDFLEQYPSICREWVDRLLSESFDHAVATARVAS